MSLPPKEEHGVKLFSWNVNDPAAGVPIKKRRFLFRRSPSPPPSHSTSLDADSCDVQSKETSSPAIESSVSRVSGPVPDTGCADLRNSSLECKVESIADREVNLAKNAGCSLSFSEGLLFTLSPTATAGIGSGGKLISESKLAFRPVLGNISETFEFRSTMGEGSCGNKLILSDKSAFQRVSANTELPLPLNKQCEPTSGEAVASLNSVKEGQPSSCKLELSLSESQSVSVSKLTDNGLGFSHDNQHSNRSHWDLNTTMDTWERSIVDSTLNHGEGKKNEEIGLGYILQKRSELDPGGKSCCESTSIHVMSGECVRTESTCSLPQPNTLKLPSEKSCINTDLNLQLNTAFGAASLSDDYVPFAFAIPSLHKDLNFSVKPTPLSQSSKLAACDAVKTEPVEEDGRSNKYTGASKFKSVNHSIIKSEAMDNVEQGGAKTISPNGMIMACGGAIKLEQMETPCLQGPRTAEGKTDYCGDCANAQETVCTGEIHHALMGSAAWSLDFVAQAVDYKKMHDILGAHNVDTSHMMEESLKKEARVFIAKPLLNDIKRDLGQDVPSNTDQYHGSSLNSESSTDIVPESVVPDVNNSLDVHVTPSVVPQDAGENVIQESELFSESTAVVGNDFTQVKGASDVVESTSGVHLDAESKRQTVANPVLRTIEQISHSDGGLQLSLFASEDVHTLQASIDSKVTETNSKEEIKEPELCKMENEPCGSHETVSAKETMPKQHGDDDDYEDGELRESLLRDAMRGSCNTKEKKNVYFEDAAKSDVLLGISPFVSQNESTLQNPDESKDVHCTLESESHLCTEKKNDAGLNMAEDVKESFSIGKPITESSKKKAVKVTRKMPRESGKDDTEMKSTCQKTPSSGRAKGTSNAGDDPGSYQAKAPVDQSAPFKPDVSQTYDATKCAKTKSEWGHFPRLSSSSNPSGRIKYSLSRSTSRSERERIKDKSIRREKIHMKSSRDESHIHRMHKFEKEREPDQALRKAGADRVHMRGRMVQQLDTLHGDWDPEHGYASERFAMLSSSQLPRPKNASEVAFTVDMNGMFESAGRTGKKHVDELCRPPPRRPSPGGSGPLPVGVQMVRRTMRDISPGRCVEGGIPELVMPNREGKLMRGFADDMVNSPLILRTRPIYEPGGNCLIRRERSLSPFERRSGPHVSNISFAPSTRPRARSPHLWSPSRRPDIFDGRPDLIRCRSPDLRVERMRSPCDRPCFQDNMLGRRHVSPQFPQLHGEMTDVALVRGRDLPKPGRHPQGNLRRFDLIDHRVNPDNFGHLQPGQFCGLEGDDVFAEERRNSDEGHELARPFRQHYIVGDDVGNDGSFHHRVEDIPSRPVRLCQDADEEFPGRGISRVGSIRNRLGNVHRRLRGMDEQEENYRHDNGQGWHGANFKDGRLKRRRF